MKLCLRFNTPILILLTCICLVFTTTLSVAQERRITGTVTSGTDNKPLAGASVEVKGTTVGTTTDPSGNFSITASTGATLVIGYVGFANQEIVVGSNSTINITLQGANASMNEVVVIGYQSVRRRDLTGATGIVNTQNTERLVSRSLPEQLQGMSPGVVVRTGGQPGQEAVVNIRGLGTFTGNANPLYIIDGMYSDPNTTVNPDDVATIQVLKDASAAAIYGSRAANGVIIITTKRGKEGDMKVNVSSRYSISQLPKRYDMMNGNEFVATNKAAYQAAGYALQPAVANYNGINTNWADEAIRTGAIQDHTVSLSGGTRNSNYFISGSYFKDIGTLIARDFERSSLRINTETSRGRFKFGENLMISNSLRNSPYESNYPTLNNFEVGNPWYDLWNNLPIIPVSDAALASNSNPGGWGMGSPNARTFSRNFVAISDITSVRTSYFKVLGNAFLDFRLFPWLTYRFNAGVETSFDRARSLRKEGVWYWNMSQKPSEVIENRSQFLNLLFEHTVNFNRKWGNHSINGVLGYTEQTIRRDNSSGGRSNLSQSNGQYFTTITSANGSPLAFGSNEQTLINSYLGRLIYNYNDRYLATFTFRSDKDSRFSPAYRTGFFPSAAVGWNIHNEKFFNVNWISSLKLRASYGELGAANLGNYQFTGFLNQGPRAVFGSGQTEQNGATQARLVAADLRWESKTTTNVGLDASLLNNRFNVTLDVFRSISNDVLVEQPLPRYLGNLGGNPLVNIGSIRNQGVELELGYRHSGSGDFTWSLSGNVSVIRNKVLSLGSLGTDPVTGLERNYIQSGNTRSQVGRSIGEYFVLRTDGIFQNQKEIEDHKAQARYAKPGDIRYVNVVNGGTNDDINDQDRQFAGSPWPKFTTGVQFNSTWKNLSFNLQLYGSFGQQLYNDVLRDLDAMGYSNYRRDINPWSSTNTNTNFPRLGVSYSTGLAGDPAVDQGIVSNVRGNTNRWIESGSYLRVRNLEIGYLLPKSLLSRLSVANSRIFVSGQNLLTFTNYSGLDPDVVGANANLEPGVDNGNYPSSRIFTVGINVGF
ncbi:TonB-dependent receptor [Segetibacter sp. 3557_3]|uniref:SusC/RagA family TonB-linked outer membrane protein n=1 Tax=Segetibacter sp. 3557_3 TaxID=2547429 RepID=UPI001058DBF9|nr:TonB-dependent receptor [Segetibacter sp. 3557_3]TDH19728.1 TonB-dependent receptor [Segetibacter sp. 3557_3]